MVELVRRCPTERRLYAVERVRSHIIVIAVVVVVVYHPVKSASSALCIKRAAGKRWKCRNTCDAIIHASHPVMTTVAEYCDRFTHFDAII